MVDVAEFLRRQIIEAQCPACHGILDRGTCSCCGSFEASTDHVFMGKGADPACKHWPIDVGGIGWPESEIRFNYLRDDTLNNTFVDCSFGAADDPTDAYTDSQEKK